MGARQTQCKRNELWRAPMLYSYVSNVIQSIEYRWKSSNAGKLITDTNLLI